MSNRIEAGGLVAQRVHPYRSFGRTVVGVARTGLETLLVWQERSEQRRALASLDARMLRDIGLSRADVEWEVAKPFWRP